MKTKEKTNKIAIIIIWIGIVISLIILGYIVYSVITQNPYSELDKTSNLNDCLSLAWTGCGLIYSENSSEMCWQTKDNIKPEWVDCQIITIKQRDCWYDKRDYCEDKFSKIEENGI